MQNTLILLRGLPGAGKSTLGKILTQNVGELIDLDSCFIDDVTEEYVYDESRLDQCQKWCYERCEMSMVKGRELIVVCNPFIQDWELQPYLNLGKLFSYQTFSLVVEQRRDHTVECEVPEDVIERMYDRFSLRL